MSKGYLPYRDLAPFLLGAVLRADRRTGCFRDAIQLGNGCESTVVDAAIAEMRRERLRRDQLGGRAGAGFKLLRRRKVPGTQCGPVDLLGVGSQSGRMRPVEFKVLLPKGKWNGAACERRRIRRDLDKLVAIHGARPDCRGALAVVGLGWRVAHLRALVLEATGARVLDEEEHKLHDGAPVAVFVLRLPTGMHPPSEDASAGAAHRARRHTGPIGPRAQHRAVLPNRRNRGRANMHGRGSGR